MHHGAPLRWCPRSRLVRVQGGALRQHVRCQQRQRPHGPHHAVAALRRDGLHRNGCPHGGDHHVAHRHVEHHRGGFRRVARHHAVLHQIGHRRDVHRVLDRACVHRPGDHRLCVRRAGGYQRPGQHHGALNPDVHLCGDHLCVAHHHGGHQRVARRPGAHPLARLHALLVLPNAARSRDHATMGACHDHRDRHPFPRMRGQRNGRGDGGQKAEIWRAQRFRNRTGKIQLALYARIFIDWRGGRRRYGLAFRDKGVTTAARQFRPEGTWRTRQQRNKQGKRAGWMP